MTNTVIIIPVNQDTRPTEFYSAFDTEDGTRVTLTISTREQGVANAITAKVETLGWQRAAVSTDTPLWQIFLLIPVGLFVLWLAGLVLGFLLHAGALIPSRIEFDGYSLDGYEQIEVGTKLFIRYALLAWLPLFAVASYFELANRKDLEKAIVQ